MPKAMRGLVAVIALSFLLGRPLVAEGPPPYLVITSASVEDGVLLIRGQSFGLVAPQVTLGGVRLSPVTRVSAQEVRVPIPAGTAPGTYLLKVARNPAKFPFSFFDVTIGAVGATGPSGPQGEKGEPGEPGRPGPGLETGEIRGRLVSCTPRDFDGTTVYVPGRSFNCITGPSGGFELSYLPPGSYELVAAKAGSRLVTVPGIPVNATLASDIGDVQTTKLDSDPLNCGSCGVACGVHESCSGGVCACAPTTCAAHSWNCGTAPDGCGGTLSCGTCTGGQTCGGGGVPNQCGFEDTCLASRPGARIVGCPCFVETPSGLKIGICP